MTDAMHHKLTAVGIPLGYVGIGLLIGGILFYLTPLKHLNVIEPLPKKIQPAIFYEAFKKNPSTYLLIDIRSEEFRAQEYPEGSLYVPLNTLAGEVNALPRNRSVVVFCESNFSATAAYHVLQNNGFLDVQMIDGGRTAWKQAGLPLIQGTDAQKRLANEIIDSKIKLIKLTR